jgi:hypothetical protein
MDAFMGICCIWFPTILQVLYHYFGLSTGERLCLKLYAIDLISNSFNRIENSIPIWASTFEPSKAAEAASNGKQDKIIPHEKE